MSKCTCSVVHYKLKHVHVVYNNLHLIIPLYVDGFFHTYGIFPYVWDCPFCTFRGELSNYGVFLSLNVVLILANSADADEMPHYAAFHRGFHCLRKYPFSGYKGLDLRATHKNAADDISDFCSCFWKLNNV